MKSYRISNPETTNENVLGALYIAGLAIREFHFIKQREKHISHLAPEYNVKNFYFADLPMGSGGVGQVKEMKNGEVRIQIGYGRGVYNYARCMVITP